MPYIESFLYYIAVVSVALVPLLLIIFILIIVSNFLRGKSMQMPTIKKIYKWFVIGYFAVFFAFYLLRNIDYYGSDRAYPQAKAYAVVADIVSLGRVAMLGMKINHGSQFNPKYYRLMYPESSLDMKFQRLQSFLLDKMYKYIPPEDGERELLYYRYQLKHIVTMDYGFMRRVDYEIYGDGLVTEGFGIYLPRQVTFHNELLDIIHKIDTKPMKDKRFDRVERYSSIFRMSYYVERHFSSFPTAERMQFLPRYRMLESNATAFGKYKEFIYFLDELYTKEENNTVLQQKLYDTPLTQAFVLGSLLRGMQNIISYQIKEGIYPCRNKESRLYLKYHKLYDKLAHSRRANRFVKGFYRQLHSYFYAAKYICGEKLDYTTDRENQTLRRKVAPEIIVRNIDTFLLDDSYGVRIEKMKELKQNRRRTQ